MASHTGNGATLSVGGTALARIVSIDGFEETLPDVDDTDLSTTDYMAFIPGDLVEHGEISGTMVFDPTEWVTAHDTLGESGTILLTFPASYGVTLGTAATLTGTGWLKTRGVGTVENNTRIEAPFSVRFKGGASGIAWTEESGA